MKLFITYLLFVLAGCVAMQAMADAWVVAPSIQEYQAHLEELRDLSQ